LKRTGGAHCFRTLTAAGEPLVPNVNDESSGVRSVAGLIEFMQAEAKESRELRD